MGVPTASADPSPESCAGVIAAVSGGVPGWAAAAISAPFCGTWLGEQNAGSNLLGKPSTLGLAQQAQVWHSRSAITPSNSNP